MIAPIVLAACGAAPEPEVIVETVVETVVVEQTKIVEKEGETITVVEEVTVVETVEVEKQIIETVEVEKTVIVEKEVEKIVTQEVEKVVEKEVEVVKEVEVEKEVVKEVEKIVTEVVDPRDVSWVAEFADVLQIGTRNMQNFSLLKEVGKSGRPVLLKRGMYSTLEEWLNCAEYILSEGNPDVILCERGIRTYETATRNTTDINAIPVLKSLTHLPVVLDVWSASCAPCKRLEPVMFNLAKEYQGQVKVAELNASRGPKSATKLRVMGTPTVIYFYKGKEKERIVGFRGQLYHEDYLENELLPTVEKDAPVQA